MQKSLIHKSKFLSLVLRHDPHRVGLQLDDQGWVKVDLLLQALLDAGTTLSPEELEEIVETNEKKRFDWDRSQNRIRANQGHSVKVDLALESMTPPEVLYHGTSISSLESIFAEGLKAGKRQHVHLSSDRLTAKQVGARHGKPWVLEVASGAMHREGHVFYLSKNGVWLTEHVPSAFFKVDG